MPNCLPKNLIPAFEDTLQRATLSGMREATNVGRKEKGESKFRVESILRYLDAAAIYTAARAKAEYLRTLWADRTPTLIDHERWDGWANNDTGTTHEPVLVDPSNVQESTPTDVSKGIDRSNMLRFRGTDQTVDGNLARRRTYGSNDDFKGRDAPPTDQAPIYIAEGGVLIIEGDEVNEPSKATCSMVLAPTTTVHSVSVTLSSGSIDTGELGEKQEETTIYLEDGSNNRYEGIYKGSQDVDSAAPDGSYTLYYFDHACSQIPERFESVIVELASSVAATSLPDGERMQAGKELFQEEVSQYIAPAFDLRQLEQ